VPFAAINEQFDAVTKLGLPDGGWPGPSQSFEPKALKRGIFRSVSGTTKVVPFPFVLNRIRIGSGEPLRHPKSRRKPADIIFRFPQT
jgi:hypothetical protein